MFVSSLARSLTVVLRYVAVSMTLSSVSRTTPTGGHISELSVPVRARADTPTTCRRESEGDNSELFHDINLAP